MTWTRLGRQIRAVRLRRMLRQSDVARIAGISRSSVSLVERGHVSRTSVGVVESIIEALDARLEPRLLWRGPELDRLADAGHAALAASIKRTLERWGWQVRVEASYNHYGERGRIDLLAWHPAAGVVAIVEIKTSLADVQSLLGSMDVKARIAGGMCGRFGWPRPRALVPMIVFAEDRTTRRNLARMAALFDRYELRGRAALSWLRRPTSGAGVPSGLLWLRDLSTARVVRISGQRVRRRREPTLGRRAEGPEPRSAAR